MRVIGIGLDGRVVDPSHDCHVVSWVREMAKHVDEYVQISQSRDGQSAGPIALAPNATAWALAGSPLTYPFRAARLGARLHAQQPFDIVTTEDPIRCGVAGALLARRTGMALNIENHSFHVNEPVWLREKLRHRLYNQIAIRVCRRADSIRNYSSGQADALLKIGVQPSRIITVPVNAPELSPIEPERGCRQIGIGPEPLILCVGRMVAYKNIPLLLKAFAGLPADLNAKLLLIGSGDAKPQWQALSSSMGLENRVIWRDAVPWSEMVAYYSAASVFAAPAVHETGPRTVLEALLCKCPVLVTPNTGVVETGICVDGETALIVPPDDIPGWTEALRRLLTDRAAARRMAEAGRARIASDISLSAIALALAEVLRKTVVRSRGTIHSLAPT